MALDMHGRIENGEAGRDLVVERVLGIDVRELWRWVTESDRTAQWYGPWAGEGRPGGEIAVTMESEEGSPEMSLRVEECAPLQRVVLQSLAPAPYDWRMALECRPEGAGSVIALRHIGFPADVPLADLGAGWEFYLGALVSAVTAQPRVPFDVWLAEIGPRYAAL